MTHKILLFRISRKIGIALSFAVAALIVVVALFAFAIDRIFDWPGSRDEVSRIASPSGRLEAVMYETNGGATTSFGYEIYVVRSGEKIVTVKGSEMANLYGAWRNESAYGANLRWQDDRTLIVEYLEASLVQLRHPTIYIGGMSVTVRLQSNVSDPSAPRGGMLYNRNLRPVQ